MRLRARSITLVLLALYTAFVLLVAFWPTHVDEPARGEITRVINTVRENGGPEKFDYYTVFESLANVAFFVPLGVLLTMALGRHRWWLALVLGLALSALIEVVQGALLPGRTGSWEDFAANAVGTLVGIGVASMGAVFREHRAVR